MSKEKQRRRGIFLQDGVAPDNTLKRASVFPRIVTHVQAGFDVGDRN